MLFQEAVHRGKISHASLPHQVRVHVAMRLHHSTAFSTTHNIKLIFNAARPARVKASRF